MNRCCDTMRKDHPALRAPFRGRGIDDPSLEDLLRDADKRMNAIKRRRKRLAL